MSNRNILGVIVVAAMAFPPASMSADEPLARSASAQANATIVAIDPASRIVTLQGQDGRKFQVEAGPDVKLDNAKVGDVVSATYTESLAFQVIGKGEKPAGASVIAKKDVGSREVGQTVTSSFKIASYEKDTHVLWVTTEQGETKKIVVQDPDAQARLAQLSPGDVVQVTYSESLALRLEKIPAK
jgi:hypothetical protein